MADGHKITGSKKALRRVAEVLSVPKKVASFGVLRAARPYLAVGALLLASGLHMNNAVADSYLAVSPSISVVSSDVSVNAGAKASSGGSLLDMGRDILAKAVVDNGDDGLKPDEDAFTYMYETAVNNLPNDEKVKEYLATKRGDDNATKYTSLRDVMHDLIPDSNNRIAEYLDGTVQIKKVKLDKKFSLDSSSAEKNIIEAVKEYREAAEVVAAIQNASTVTGVDFNYLYAKAGMESRFDPKVRAHGKVTSATGLYQFINKTWLSMVKNHGEAHGIEPRLVKAAQMSYKKLRKTDKKTLNEILELRKDAKISALMGAEFALENQNFLKRNHHKNIGPSELYMAHFLGAGGANLFLKRMKRDSHTLGAQVFPKAASTNHGRFYSGNGRPLTLAEIYKSAGRDIDWYNKVKDKGVEAYSEAHLKLPIPVEKPNIGNGTELASLDVSKLQVPNKPK